MMITIPILKQHHNKPSDRPTIKRYVNTNAMMAITTPRTWERKASEASVSPGGTLAGAGG
jgi:hypothetical protein